MSELDKFKRRLIRSVARRQLLQDQNEEEAWNQLRKQTGCDCKLLWDRMRALTIKKLKRLLAADDKLDNVATVARLSKTDWLLFDLVLVHEKIDVINKESIAKNVESTALVELFDLVCKYGVETKKSDQLADAWTCVTREYNSKGRLCSPMLLQRRWYQLKELTRANFYKLWFNYRGNQKLWDQAQEDKRPTELQSDIAKQFPNIITRAFPEWEELIQQGKVIVDLEEFEIRARKNSPKPTEDKTDLVMIEPRIETIDLGEDSGAEEANQPSNTDEEQQYSVDAGLETVKIKQETIDFEEDGLMNVQILEATHIPTEDIDTASTSQEITNTQYKNKKELELECLKLQQQNEDLNLVSKSPEAEEVGEADAVKTQVELILNSKLEAIRKPEPKHTESNEAPQKQVIEILPLEDEEDCLIPDDLIKQKADEYIRNSKVKTAQPEIKETGIQSLVQDVVDDIIKQKADDYVRKVEVKKQEHDVEDSNIPMSMDFVDDGIEFIDDGIELIEEGDDIIQPVVKKKEPVDTAVDVEPEEENSKDSTKFDLKLLMDPVVYTTKLDHMTIFKDKPFHAITEKTIIDKVILESIPVSKQTMDVDLQKEPEINMDLNVQKDAEKSDDLFNNDCNKHVNNESNNVIIESNNVIDESNVINVDRNDVIDESSGEEEDRIEISENLKVKPTSNLLQKPKRRSYNLVQLCKNPDFNTRLKRLTTGFFCSTRNRQLLNACKPLTIDVSKSFESRLVDGTLYLKSGVVNIPEGKEEETVQTTSVVPSVMAVQSLLNDVTSKADIQDLVAAPTLSSHFDSVDLTKPTKRSNVPETEIIEDDAVQRNKVINLKDLSEIRRINQKLLTAEVTPMRLENADYKKPSVRINELHAALLEDLGQIESREPKEPEILSTLPKQDKIIPVKESLLIDNNLLVEKSNQRKDLRFKNACKPGPKTKTRFFSEKNSKFPTYAQMPRRRVAVPWLTKVKAAPVYDDSLLTIDTLNRMINKLAGDNEFQVITDTKKKFPQKTLQAYKETTDKEATETTAESVEVNNTAQSIPLNKIEKKKKGRKRKKFQYYCCWSNEKLVKSQTNARMRLPHSCSGSCTCCCREQLEASLKLKSVSVYKKNTSLVDQTSETNTIVLSDDENRAESTVTMKNDASTQFNDEIDRPMPKIRVHNATPKPPISPKIQNMAAAHEYPVRLSQRGRGRPAVIKSVQSQPPEPPPELQPEIQPVLRVNINFTPALPTEALEPPPINPAAMLQSIPFDPPNITQVVPRPMLEKETVLCPTPTINAGQRSIVIDASKPNYILNETTNDKPTKKKENPIFLGKNKLLLTDVKFPPHLANKEDTEDIPPANVVPISPLPPGLQLVLLPDGQLSYIVNPNVELTAAEMEILPSILAAVQAQINGTQHNVAPIAADESGTCNIPQINLSVPEQTENCAIDSTEQIVSNVDNTLDNINQPSENVESSVIVTSSVDSSSADIHSIEKDNTHGENIVTNNNGVDESNEGSGASRNLLSDLMEMSGISAADATSAQEESTVSKPPPVVSAEQAKNLPSVASAEPQNLPGLTPINSLAQLKYACDNNGKFFKLDLQTGAITKIAVCIKKQVKKTPNPVILPKSVIDLTEDFDLTPGQSEPVTPVKMFKAHSILKPNILHRHPLVFTKRNKLLPSQLLNKHNRKQSLNQKIEAKIDLVDSDEPMEEEYLVDSFDSDDSSKDPRKTVPATNVVNEVSDDSSDDEPLAKKSKRIRTDNDSKPEPVRVDSAPIENENALNEKGPDSVDTSAAVDLPVEATQPLDDVEQDFDGASSDMELEESAMLSFLADESESQEDCILGV